MLVRISIFIFFLLFSLQFVLGQENTNPKKLSLGVLNEKAKVLVLPKLPNVQPRVAGSVNVQVEINLQTGEVVSASAVSGHPLLRGAAVAAARKAKFQPILTEFDTIYGTGILIYKLEDFTSKVIESEKANDLLPILDIKTAIINGRATKLEKPAYPEEARNFCAAGKVEALTLFNNWSGEVFAAKAISGDELLYAASEKAVLKSKFSPSNFNGDNDFYVLGKIIYNFDYLAPKCVPAGIVNKKAQSLPKPQVPNLNQPKHLRITEEQVIAVQIIVGINGKVTEAKAITGHPLLRPFCEYAARQAKFLPIWDVSPSIKIRALLVYKIKPDGTIETGIEKDDKIVIGTPINLVEPPPPFCNCRLGGSVLVQAKIDKQGNVTEAKAFSGHPILRISSEKAALESKFLPTNTKATILISYNFESNDSGRTAKIKNIEIKEVRIEKKVFEDTITGKAINLVKPPLPSFNGKLGDNKTVLIEAEIDEKGNVISAKAISGHPILRAVCQMAARVSRFSQTMVSGVPVKAKALITYEYVLDDEETVNIIVNGIEPQADR